MASFGAHRAEGDGLDDLSPRFNGSPGQDYPIIVREPDVAGAVFCGRDGASFRAG